MVRPRRRWLAIGLVAAALCGPIAAWYIAGLVTAGNFRRRLRECSAIQLTRGGGSYVVHKGDVAFTDVLGAVEASLAWGPTFRWTSKSAGTLLFYDDSGEVIGSAEMYAFVFVIGPYMYAFDSSGTAWAITESWYKRTYEHPDGSRKAEGGHKEDQKNGTWVYYYETGVPRSTGDYDHGAKTGKWTYWDENGKMTSEKWYVHNKEVSEQEYRTAVRKRE